MLVPEKIVPAPPSLGVAGVPAAEVETPGWILRRSEHGKWQVLWQGRWVGKNQMMGDDKIINIDEYGIQVKGAVQRQVMLEAKIIDVELNDNYQSGIDWNRLFANIGNTAVSLGVLGTNTGGLRSLPTAGVNIPNLVSMPALGSGAYGFSIAASNFDAVLAFLESFGSTRVLSSPRIATLNNQRALLKVGTDEFFITSATPGFDTAALKTVQM